MGPSGGPSTTAPFSGRVAVVTGARSGIGRAIALGLAGLGASICLVGRWSAALGAVADEVRAAGAGAVQFIADLADEDALDGLVSRLRADLDRVDFLVQSAGVIELGSVAAAPVADLDRQYRINLRAPFVLTQGLLPLLRSSAGQVVFINSSAAMQSRANASQYSATKHGLRALADGLRREVNNDGIRVLSIYPGRTATPMQEGLRKLDGRADDPERMLQPEDVAQTVIQALRLPRTAEITDIHIRPMQKS